MIFTLRRFCGTMRQNFICVFIRKWEDSAWLEKVWMLRMVLFGQMRNSKTASVRTKTEEI